MADVDIRFKGLGAAIVKVGHPRRRLHPFVRARFADRVMTIGQVLKFIVAVVIGHGGAAIAQRYLPAFQRRFGRLIPDPVAVDVQVV